MPVNIKRGDPRQRNAPLCVFLFENSGGSVEGIAAEEFSVRIEELHKAVFPERRVIWGNLLAVRVAAGAAAEARPGVFPVARHAHGGVYYGILAYLDSAALAEAGAAYSRAAAVSGCCDFAAGDADASAEAVFAASADTGSAGIYGCAVL